MVTSCCMAGLTQLQLLRDYTAGQRGKLWIERRRLQPSHQRNNSGS